MKARVKRNGISFVKQITGTKEEIEKVKNEIKKLLNNKNNQDDIL